MKKLVLLFLTLALSAVALADGSDPMPICRPTVKRCSFPAQVR